MQYKNILKRMSVLSLSGMLLLSGLIVQAEEPQKDEMMAVTEEAVPEITAEKQLPTLLTDTVTWNGGTGEIPIDLGDYTADELTVVIMPPKGDNMMPNNTLFSVGQVDLISENGLNKVKFSSFISGITSCGWVDPFWTKAGSYDLDIVIYRTSDSVSPGENPIQILETLPFKVVIPSDNTLWKTTDQKIDFDGSKDVTFTFENGTNCARLEKISQVSIDDPEFAGFMDKLVMLDTGVSFDPDKGTVTINKNALKEAIQELKSKDGLSGDFVQLRVSAENAQGDMTEFNWIGTDQKHRVAWSVDISNLSFEVPESIFSDVKAEDWHYDYVKYVKDRGLMTGLNETTFGPAESLYRAQFATIVYRMENSPEIGYSDKFPDIADAQWYTDPVLWASEAGIVTGYSNTGYFGPSDKINREQMAVMMYRYAKYKGFDVEAKESLEAFPDAENVNDFAKDAVEWCVGAKIITGKNGKIDPQGEANRAECATIITRFMEYYGI